MRWLHRLWAFVGGYFWLPCPRCGEMFGGHESGRDQCSYSHAGEPSPYQNRVLCPPCTQAESDEAYARAFARSRMEDQT